MFEATIDITVMVTGEKPMTQRELDRIVIPQISGVKPRYVYVNSGRGQEREYNVTRVGYSVQKALNLR